MGDDAGENARNIIEQLRNESAAYAAIAEAKARSAIQREAQRHTQAWTASVKAGTQIDIGRLLADDDLVQLLSLKSEEFVGLIRSLSSDTIQRIERQVLGSIFEGRSNADIAKALREIEGIGLNRAKLIARDQASKLNGALNQFRQEQAGVTHFRWKTILDGRERASHHAKNGKVFKWADPVEKPGQAINCFPAGTMVQADALAATRHWYEGRLVTIETASGNKLTGTPNHPVLSGSGWKGLGQLHEGDHVLCRLLVQNGTIGAAPSVDHADVPIEQVFESLARDGVHDRVALADVDFHGDRPTHDVDVIRPKSELVDVVDAGGSQAVHHPIFEDANLAQCDLFGASALRQLLIRALHAAHRIMGGASEFLAFGFRCLAHPQQHALAAAPWGNACILEARDDCAAKDAKFGGDRLHRPIGRVKGKDCRPNAVSLLTLLEGQRLISSAQASRCADAGFNVPPVDVEALNQLAHRSSGAIHLDRVVKVYVSDFVGHVYNLEASAGAYLAHGIVCHNCRCRALAVLEEYED